MSNAVRKPLITEQEMQKAKVIAYFAAHDAIRGELASKLARSRVAMEDTLVRAHAEARRLRFTGARQ